MWQITRGYWIEMENDWRENWRRTLSIWRTFSSRGRDYEIPWVSIGVLWHDTHMMRFHEFQSEFYDIWFHEIMKLIAGWTIGCYTLVMFVSCRLPWQSSPRTDPPAVRWTNRSWIKRILPHKSTLQVNDVNVQIADLISSTYKIILNSYIRWHAHF